jgi:hypothetical protein
LLMSKAVEELTHKKEARQSLASQCVDKRTRKRLPRRFTPRNDSKVGCHRERSVAISFIRLLLSTSSEAG